MTTNTKIEWATHTFNPWWGCARVSAGCRFCYADTLASRWGHELWRRHGPRKRMSDQYWKQPLKWNRSDPGRVFCASMADVFEDHPEPQVAQFLDSQRARLWDLIDSTPNLTWLLLTKRPGNVPGMAPWGDDWPARVWMGTSVEDQRNAGERIPLLLRVPAAVRFLSCEPLIAPVDLTDWMPPGHGRWRCSGCRRFYAGAWSQVCPGCGRENYWCGSHVGNGRPHGQPISWIIVGGESGSKARPMHPDWARSLRDQCQAASVPFLFKQWGGRTSKAGGRELDSRFWDEFPTAVTL